MIAAYESHDTTTFVQALGSVLRSVLDFNSYTTLSASQEEPSLMDQFLGVSRANSLPEETA